MRAMLLQVLYSVRSERQLVEQIQYNLLFRWFVWLAIEDSVWNHSVFSKNRDRLIEHDAVTELFNATVEMAEQRGLLSGEHFSVDGTLIQGTELTTGASGAKCTWASMRRRWRSGPSRSRTTPLAMRPCSQSCSPRSRPSSPCTRSAPMALMTPRPATKPSPIDRPRPSFPPAGTPSLGRMPGREPRLATRS